MSSSCPSVWALNGVGPGVLRLAPRNSMSTPPLSFFGKGFGDLPDTMNWARPFAITGQVGYAVPARSKTLSINTDTGDVDAEFNAKVLTWGGSIQYSMPYLKSAVIDLNLPEFINHLIPIVEFSLQTPVSNTLTSGTVTTGTLTQGCSGSATTSRSAWKPSFRLTDRAVPVSVLWLSYIFIWTTSIHAAWGNQSSALPFNRQNHFRETDHALSVPLCSCCNPAA